MFSDEGYGVPKAAPPSQALAPPPGQGLTLVTFEIPPT